jgi:hypothetical protein
LEKRGSTHSLRFRWLPPHAAILVFHISLLDADQLRGVVDVLKLHLPAEVASRIVFEYE